MFESDLGLKECKAETRFSQMGIVASEKHLCREDESGKDRKH